MFLSGVVGVSACLIGGRTGFILLLLSIWNNTFELNFPTQSSSSHLACFWSVASPVHVRSDAFYSFQLKANSQFLVPESFDGGKPAAGGVGEVGDYRYSPLSPAR